MKVYKCDACGRIIDNPHKAKMKEFIQVAAYEYGARRLFNAKQKIKIDICDECYGALKTMAMIKAVNETRGPNNADKKPNREDAQQ